MDRTPSGTAFEWRPESGRHARWGLRSNLGKLLLGTSTRSTSLQVKSTSTALMEDSIVVCGPYQGNAAFVSVRGNLAKVRNLRRDPGCTMMTVDTNWRGYVVVEGRARLYDYSNTDHEELRQMLREVCRACGGDHPDWEQ